MDHNNSSSHLHRQLDWVTTLIPFGAILVLCLLILPYFMGIYGAWLAVPIAEAVTLLVTVPFHKTYFIGRGKKSYLW